MTAPPPEPSSPSDDDEANEDREADVDSSRPSEPRAPPASRGPESTRLRELAIGGAWMWGLSALVMIIEGFLASVPIARAILGGLLVSVVGARSGFVWDLDDPDGLSSKRALTATARGMGLAATATFATLVVAHFLGWATIHPGRPDAMTLLALLTVAANAVREEVILRAIPMHFARRAGLSPSIAIGFSALASAAPMLLAASASPASVTLAIAAGLLAARLFHTTRSLYAAVGANLAVAFVVGPFSGGSVLDVKWVVGELAKGPNAAGPPAYLLAALLVIVALVGAQTRRRRAASGSSISSKSASSTTG